jgi:hypothetical protein
LPRRQLRADPAGKLEPLVAYAFADAEPGARPNNVACSRRATSTSRPVASSISA